MNIIGLIVEVLFHNGCGWIGNLAVKIVTFGKVDLETGDSSETILTECIGAGVAIGLAVVVSLIIG